MNQYYQIEHIATMSIEPFGYKYNFREMNEVEKYVNSISYSNKGRWPLYSYWFGCEENSSKGFIDSINILSGIYSKESGIRLRGVVADVNKSISNNSISTRDIVNIANGYVRYYLYQGYITGVIIYDMGDFYRLYYLINPVSYWDGGKFKTNKTDCIIEEYAYFQAAIEEVLLREGVVAFEGFIACPLMF